MSAIDQVFAELRRMGRKAFMPFITAGDPDLAVTAAVLKELAARGSHLCEVGIPYSDPIADGPVIQDSYSRALNHKIKVHDILNCLQGVTGEVSAPVVTMVSYAIVHRVGPAQYVADAQRAGVAGAIIPDMPVDEAAAMARLCRQADFSLIQLVTPTTPRERALRIAENSTGFVYYVSVTGITGERTQLPPDLAESVAWLRSKTPLPVCIGFGISTPEHIQLLAPVADGLIVGSAIVRRMAEKQGRPPAEVAAHVGAYVGTLLAAF